MDLLLNDGMTVFGQSRPGKTKKDIISVTDGTTTTLIMME